MGKEQVCIGQGTGVACVMLQTDSEFSASPFDAERRRPFPSRACMPVPRLSEPKPSRGIHWQMIGDRRAYCNVTSAGFLLEQFRLPVGDETDDDVIVALADALDAADPQLRLLSADCPSSSAPPRAPELPRHPRVLVFPA